jgi:cytochrome c553
MTTDTTSEPLPCRRAAFPRSVWLVATAISAVWVANASAQSLVDDFAWAYAITPGTDPPPPVDDGSQRRLPGTDRTFTLDQIRNRFGPADWFPGDHPSMPPVVTHGREAAGVWACSLCHYPNGKGRPENAGVAGLPKEYFAQQLYDMKHGLRTSADMRKPNTPRMIGFAAAMTDEEIQQAAEYFAAMKWTPWIDVIETRTVPKTAPRGGMYLRLEGAQAGTEPLGRRIIETPRNTEYTEVLRNPRSDFIAYVPIGAVARGKSLAMTGNGRTTQCSVCHGETLNGLALIPSLRGRSPSYVARQLVDFKQGTRRGPWAPLMAQVVAKLSADDILSLSAYLASLPPEP